MGPVSQIPSALKSHRAQKVSCGPASQQFKEAPWTAKHLQRSEVICSSASSPFLLLSEWLRINTKEQQGQSSSTNKMTQRKGFKVVLLPAQQPGAPMHHSDMKGVNGGSCQRGYFRDVQLPSAAFSDHRSVFIQLEKKFKSSKLITVT